MATRSRIGIQLADDAILSVYHHWDGYPQWLGVTLNSKFNTREKVAELIDGGDISCCDSDTDWDRNEVPNHVQYYNDRGEKTEPRLDLNEYEFFINNEEYAYIFEDGKWTAYDLSHKYDDNYQPASYIAEPIEIIIVAIMDLVLSEFKSTA